MAATAPARARRHGDAVRIRTPFSVTLVLLLASACSPVGWVSEPLPPAPLYPAATEDGEDGSADGAGDPAGIEEILGEEGGPPSPPPDLSLLDPAGVAWDLQTFMPGFLAAGLPPAALDQVLHNVALFHTGRARSNFERWLVREGRYRELILSELSAAGLPEELLYLSMLESGFSPTAVSRAGAVGLWQFMPATGRESGLRVDEWVDERRDPIASTRAAVKHLSYLYRELADWSLAAAAYNAGLGRVRRTRGDSGEGYFDMTLSGRLPAETRGYVPLILAASHVARNRELYGFGRITEDPPLRYETVDVEGRTRLSALALAADLPVAELTALNTHLVRGAAPPGQSYPLRVPVGTASAEITVRLAAMSEDDRLLPEYREIYAVVRAGDSWWRIANAHGVSVKDLRARNPRAGDVIHPGQRLLVDRRVVRDGESRSVAVAATQNGTRSAGGPAAPVADAAAATPAAPGTPAPAATTAGRVAQPQGGATYQVRRGDTMSGIAAARGIPLADLARWNGMAQPRPLREGEVIRVGPAEPRRHRVERGETMTSVARRHGVTIDELVRWNGMTAARPLREGETLVVEDLR
jgi:LysM repeat protein